MEEIVFRRVLFGGIYTKSNFWVAAILSGFIFAVVHGELEHTLIYMAPGIGVRISLLPYEDHLDTDDLHLLNEQLRRDCPAESREVLKQLQNMKQAFIFFLNEIKKTSRMGSLFYVIQML